MKPRVAIVDYEMGNVFSLKNALEYCGALALVTRKPDELRRATHLVLPGDGAFRTGMENLKRFGLIPILEEEVLKKKRPFLGICIGMQLLAQEGTEDGIWEGLGWVKGKIVKLKGHSLRLPHVGWDDITYKENCYLFSGIPQQADFYFIHSFCFVCKERQDVIASCRYGQNFAAAIEKQNIFGTQFHPEKSQTYGLKLLKNFISC
ncbi:imidazole glycerol phosphate synthase subunit HisH [Candidatus Collierbacteria bacterium]|nr:imidazole glycerol phosphate synthase subunit HisH [Candidatus Collierbacteria bacterium]